MPSSISSDLGDLCSSATTGRLVILSAELPASSMTTATVTITITTMTWRSATITSGMSTPTSSPFWTPWVYFDVRVNLGYCSDATTAVFVKDSVAPAACSPTARHVRRGAWQHYFNSAFLVIFVCVQHQCWCRLLLQPRGRQLRIRELRRRPRQRQRRRR